MIFIPERPVVQSPSMCLPDAGDASQLRGDSFGQTGAVTARAELTRRAQAHGVAISYRNWRGRLVEGPRGALAAGPFGPGAVRGDGGCGGPTVRRGVRG